MMESDKNWETFPSNGISCIYVQIMDSFKCDKLVSGAASEKVLQFVKSSIRHIARFNV